MRGDFLKTYLSSEFFAIDGAYFNAVASYLNSGAGKEDMAAFAGTNDEGVRQPISYKEQSNVAVISVNGAMVSFLSPMQAQCGGIASYDALNSMIAKAESSNNIDTVLFRVQSPGGAVSGAQVTAQKIKNMKKKTVVLCEDLFASAAIMIFGAAQTRYASSRTTFLGSIGVKTMLPNNDGTLEIVSSNAPNKTCNGSECRAKIQERVDALEAEFIGMVSDYTGLSNEQVISGFDNGGIITAKSAQDLGFISGISDYDKIITSLIKKGERMEDITASFTADQITAIVAENATLKAQAMSDKESMIAVAIFGAKQGISSEDMKAALFATSDKGTSAGLEHIMSVVGSTGVTGGGVFEAEKAQEKKPVDIEALAELYSAISQNHNHI